MQKNENLVVIKSSRGKKNPQHHTQKVNHQVKVAKIPSARISLTYIHVFCSPY